MKENLSQNTRIAIANFVEMEERQQLYEVSIIINHIENGLVNDGNYSDEDEAYENDKLVFKMSDVLLDNPMALATSLLLIGAKLDKVDIDPNGIDIEPYIKDSEKLKMSDFYKLTFKEKIDFITEIFYIISEIKEVEENLDFDFNELIGNMLDYSNKTFGRNEKNNLEIE